MKKLLFLLVLLVPRPARAWWAEGHMVVAQIAYQRLSPIARARADALLAVEAQDPLDAFVAASVWADELKDNGVRFYDDWHYLDTPIGSPPPNARPEGRLLWALNRCVAVLKPRFSREGKPVPPAPDAERARAMKFLIHLVGDAHQPLHAASWYGKETPRGDRGGNDFKLNDGNNLHKLWDSAGDQFLPLIGNDHHFDYEQASSGLTKRVPPDAVPQWRDADFANWIAESTAIARKDVYTTPRGQKPTAAYVARLEQISAHRIALAGYRLADLLNRIFEADAAPASTILPHIAHVRFVSLVDSWTGLSPLSPINRRWTLERGAADWAGYGSFSIRSSGPNQKLASVSVRIPHDVMDKFLHTILRTQLSAGTYKPSILYTDSYPSRRIELVTNDGTLAFFSESQGATGDPWGAMWITKPYLVGGPSPAIAFDLLRPYLHLDEYDTLLKQAQGDSQVK